MKLIADGLQPGRGVHVGVDASVTLIVYAALVAPGFGETAKLAVRVPLPSIEQGGEATLNNGKGCAVAVRVQTLALPRWKPPPVIVMGEGPPEVP